MFSNLCALRNLFKWLLIVYTVLLFVIVHKLQDDNLNQTVVNGEKQLELLNKTHWELRPKTVNITQFVYINRTEIIFKSEYIPKYGPGDDGAPVSFPQANFTSEEMVVINTNRKQHGFNTFISDLVSLQRRNPDKRQEACKKIKYPPNLPEASVVIIFRDEWWSILLRTAYSVLLNSPHELIREVILVDDGSLNMDLRRRVEIHVKSEPKFRLVRNEVPMGLMMARQKGIEATRSDYFIVMDGHMEATPGWLEPLIARLVEEPNACLCSHIGAILADDLKLNIDEPDDPKHMFDSQFPFFDPMTLDQFWAWYKEDYRNMRNQSVTPLEFGTVQGMMVVMRKAFFMQLGGFDPGMRIWGTEQMELSVKVWLCGGRVEMIPCSKVAHMYRNTPWGGVKMSYDYGSLNKARFMDVWMDGEIRDTVRYYINDKKFDVGDLTDRHKIRIENNCKPFQFYLDKIKSLTYYYLPEGVQRRGQVYNEVSNRCFDIATFNSTFNLILYECHKQIHLNQYFIFPKEHQIRSTLAHVLNVVRNHKNESFIEVSTQPYNWDEAASKWNLTPDGAIVHTVSGLCITVNGTMSGVNLSKCLGTNDQIWQWNVVKHPTYQIRENQTLD